VLWDCLPKGLFLGGAPINAAYHLGKQGLTVLPVTAVGQDFLGDEVTRRVASWGLSTKFIARDSKHPTGTVSATLNAAGIAEYQIRRDVAWDYIPSSPELLARTPEPTAIVFGTLALRSTRNRQALQTLLDAWPDALRVVDLNFRPPFDTAGVTRFALKNAQLVKLNDAELAQLTQSRGRSTHTLERGAKRLAERYELTRVCVTAGSRGAGLLWDGEWFWENSQPVEVRDTVGAGDAFLGALLGALLLKHSRPAEALAQACRVGEFVASRDGATPDYRINRQGRPVEE
jgi:fructokinase